MFISSEDFFVIGLLVFLEGILSIDNALVLAMLARPLPQKLQRRALTYGFAGAIIFRFIAVSLASHLMRWTWVKFVGGAYLVILAGNHLFFKSKKEENSSKKSKVRGFWATVLLIELTDVAFAVDSILAAVALTPKFWLVFTGGVLGILLMRFAASFFLKMLEKFPNFERVAYYVVLWIGLKLGLESAHIPGLEFHNTQHPAFWTFWILMATTIAFGFVGKRSTKKP